MDGATGGALGALVLAKVLYFSTGLASVGWNRFQNLYFLNHGIPPAQIGELKTIGLVLKFIGEPIWCIIADLTDPKLVFLLSLAAGIGSLEILRNASQVTYHTIILVKLIRTATAPQATLTTIASMKLIEGSTEGYGQQRMYGSLAWGLGAYMVGMMIDAYGTDSMFYFTYFFQIVSLIIVFKYLPTKPTGVNSLSTLDDSHEKSESLERGGGSPMIDGGRNEKRSAKTGLAAVFNVYTVGKVKLDIYVQELRQFVKNRCCRVILFNAILYGACMQTVDTWLFICLEQDYHANKAYSGLCVFASTISCIPIFYYSKKVISLYGHSNMILASHAALVLRLVLLSLMSPTWVHHMYGILAVQLLHGFCYALFWTASVDAVFCQSPKHLVTSCMATLNLSYQAVGFGIGSLAWGYVYEYLGGMTIFFYALAILASTLAGFYFYSNRFYVDVAMTEKASSDDGGDDDEKGMLLGEGGRDYNDNDKRKLSGSSSEYV